MVGGSSFEEGRAVAKTSDGNFIVAGTTSSFGAGNKDGYLVKANWSDGSVVWTKTFGLSGDEEFFAITPLNSGGFAAVGYTNSFGNGQKDIYVVKIGYNGIACCNSGMGGTTNNGTISFSSTSTGNNNRTFSTLGRGNLTSGGNMVLHCNN